MFTWGPDGVLTRLGKGGTEIAGTNRRGAARFHAVGRKDREITRKRKLLEAKISSLQTEFESIEEELNKTYQEEELAKQVAEKTRHEMTHLRREGKG